MQLGPSFLKQTDPELTIPARRESRLAITLTHRQVIINDHWRLRTVDKKAHHVYSCLIDLFSDEHCLDPVRELSQRAQRRQEVTVTQLPLINVVRLDPIFKDVDRLVDLAGAFPTE